MTNFYLFETRPTFKQSSALCKKQFFTNFLKFNIAFKQTELKNFLSLQLFLNCPSKYEFYFFVIQLF